MTTIPQLSVDAQMLVKRLAQAKPGEVIEYSELNRIVPDRNLLGKDRYVVCSARRVVQREHKIVFAPVKGKGLQRMTDDELAEIHHSTLDKIRGDARRGTRKLLCAEYEKLDNAHRVEHNTGLAVLGTITHFTRKDSVQKIGFQTATEQKRLSFKETIEQFQKGSK